MRLALPERLPPLKGWALLLVRALWVLCALALLLNIGFSFGRQRDRLLLSQAFYKIGVQSGVSRGGSGIPLIPVSVEARKALGQGEQLLTIDGHPIDYSDDHLVAVDRGAIARELAGEDGTLVTLGLLRADGTRHAVRLTRSDSRDGLTASQSRPTSDGYARANYWIGQAGFLLSLLAGALMILRRPHDAVAALLALSLVEPSNLGAVWPAEPTWVWVIISSVWLFFMALGIVLFPEGRLRPRWVLAPAITLLVLHLMIYFTPERPWLASPLEDAMVADLMVVVAAVVIRYRATPPGIARQQIKFVLLGFVLFFFLAVAQLVLGQAISRVDDNGLRGWLTILLSFAAASQNVVVALGLLVSLLRYRLYDADAVISRSAAYALLTVLLGAAFAGSEKVIEVLGEELFGESSRALSAGLGAAVAAVMIAPLHNRVHRWTEKRFQRTLSRLREGLPRTVADMREYASLDQLLSNVTVQIEKGVRATRAAVLLSAGGGPLAPALTRHVGANEIGAWQLRWHPGDAAVLECDREDAVFPLRMRLHAEGAGTIGWLLLGPRPDGSFYGKDEREALAEVADPVARAVHIVRQRSTRDAQIFSRIHALEGEFARLLRSDARRAPGTA